MRACFKLYPWEWMAREAFAAMLPRAHTRWLEPAWKMVASNKGILAVLWELYPGHPNLLPAFLEPGDLRSYARKPLLSREGANVTLVRDGEVIAEGTDDGYGKEGYVWQALWEPAVPMPRSLSIGSWLVRGVPAGAGLRESDGPITGNLSRFVPHLVSGDAGGDPRLRARFRAIGEGR
jgi:glutathionylspermidine synthase